MGNPNPNQQQIVAIDAGTLGIAAGGGIAGTDWVVDVVADYRQAHVYPSLQARWTVTEINQATKALALPEVKAETMYITGSGHGDPDTFKGDKFQPIFEINNYAPQLVEGKLVHLLSCYTADELGPDFVASAGCLAFFGYDADFMFVSDDPDSFLNCDSQVDLALANGNDAGTAYQLALTAFNQAIAVANAKKNDLAAAVLEYNRDNFCGPGKPDSNGTFGKTTAKLS